MRVINVGGYNNVVEAVASDDTVSPFAFPSAILGASHLRLCHLAALVALATNDKYWLVLHGWMALALSCQGCKRCMALYEHASIYRDAQSLAKLGDSIRFVLSSAVRKENEGNASPLQCSQCFPRARYWL